MTQVVNLRLLASPFDQGFTCAESNANAKNLLFSLICIGFGTYQVRRLKRALVALQFVNSSRRHVLLLKHNPNPNPNPNINLFAKKCIYLERLFPLQIVSVSTVLLDTARLIMEAKNASDKHYYIHPRYNSVAFVNKRGFSGLVLRRPIRVAALAIVASVCFHILECIDFSLVLY